MSDKKLAMILVWILAMGWSWFYWVYTYQSNIAYMPPCVSNNDCVGSITVASTTVSLPVQVLPPQGQIDELPPQIKDNANTVAVVPSGTDITGDLQICGNNFCAWDMPFGTPFALINYCNDPNGN